MQTIQTLIEMLLVTTGFLSIVYLTFFVASRGWRDGHGPIRTDNNIIVHIEENK